MQSLNTNLWNPVKTNKNERFYFLKESSEMKLPDLVIDFKRFYAVPREIIYQIEENKYISSLNVPYREDVTRRFANYISRIGLPDAVL